MEHCVQAKAILVALDKVFGDGRAQVQIPNYRCCYEIVLRVERSRYDLPRFVCSNSRTVIFNGEDDPRRF